ncbi:hypothetical protein FHX44_111032 [Pseudonocardia hierapolitana]|uniref:Uncharacterized protein n=1 Tax=Pseudonocardia hierapolitana TaxID=1128676 RepID=A0A561SJS9_9PSEU|nr:hypothetical protein [Pseudonocardia hierapolitana]TWF75148.1 hypothetical protein FHX44_111032 [Pseudonocardia hierapolitana]
MRPDPDGAPVAGRLPRRTSDRIEDAVAWFLTGAVLVVIVIGAVTGLAVHRGEAERAELDSRATSQTRAVLLENAHVALSLELGHTPAQVRARWADREGREHVGVVPAMRSQPAGAEVDVWIDAAGEIASRPVHPANAVFGGIVAAIGVVCAGGTPLLAAWFGVRRLTGRYNSRQWEQEWVRVEPLWRRTIL